MMYESIVLLTGLWNSLPNWIISADATNTFKTDLITFGRIRKLYDFRAQLQGTGSRSEV